MPSQFAAEEERRADGMAARAAQITASPTHPSRSSLPLYQACARTAYETAAANTAQPQGQTAMNLLTQLADRARRFIRITCPHCPATVIYRGVGQAEETRLRMDMADHIHGHDTKPRHG